MEESATRRAPPSMGTRTFLVPVQPRSPMAVTSQNSWVQNETYRERGLQGSGSEGPTHFCSGSDLDLAKERT